VKYDEPTFDLMKKIRTSEQTKKNFFILGVALLNVISNLRTIMIHARYRNEAFSAQNKRVGVFFSPPNTADLTDMRKYFLKYNLYKKI